MASFAPPAIVVASEAAPPPQDVTPAPTAVSAVRPNALDPAANTSDRAPPAESSRPFTPGACSVRAVSRCLASGLLAAALAAIALPAAASDAAPGDAERLFDEGRRLYDARRFAEACDLLAASVRAEEGVGSLGMLAACHEEIDKPATASREYERAADLARRMGDGREGYARARAASLRQLAGRLRFRFAERAPGEQVSIGGAPIDSRGRRRARSIPVASRSSSTRPADARFASGSTSRAPRSPTSTSPRSSGSTRPRRR